VCGDRERERRGGGSDIEKRGRRNQKGEKPKTKKNKTWRVETAHHVGSKGKKKKGSDPNLSTPERESARKIKPSDQPRPKEALTRSRSQRNIDYYKIRGKKNANLYFESKKRRRGDALVGVHCSVLGRTEFLQQKGGGKNST